MALDTELKGMAIADILSKYPQTEPVFQQFGLKAYAGTETAKYENLEASALVHNLNLEALLAALSRVVAS